MSENSLVTRLYLLPSGNLLDVLDVIGCIIIAIAYDVSQHLDQGVHNLIVSIGKHHQAVVQRISSLIVKVSLMVS